MSVVKDARRIVIKVGTSTLAHAGGHLNLRRIGTLTRVLADLRNSGREVLLVTSGAIGVGAGQMGLTERPHDTVGKQAAAAVGQSALMYTYDRQFAEYGQTTAQILLTHDDVDHEVRRGNVTNTLERLLEYHVLPIINENDTVATEEIGFGDNDTLSAMVACLVKADLLVLLSDIDGLYDRDPHKFSDAKLLPRVRACDDTLMALGGDAGSSLGTGGMHTKLVAARMAGQAGIPTVIMNGAYPERLYDLFDGQPIGTLFESEDTSNA